jgi:hypothetical protein
MERTPLPDPPPRERRPLPRPPFERDAERSEIPGIVKATRIPVSARLSELENGANSLSVGGDDRRAKERDARPSRHVNLPALDPDRSEIEQKPEPIRLIAATSRLSCGWVGRGGDNPFNGKRLPEELVGKTIDMMGREEVKLSVVTGRAERKEQGQKEDRGCEGPVVRREEERDGRCKEAADEPDRGREGQISRRRDSGEKGDDQGHKRTAHHGCFGAILGPK